MLVKPSGQQGGLAEQVLKDVIRSFIKGIES
jgi:hypothetical protein